MIALLLPLAVGWNAPTFESITVNRDSPAGELKSLGEGWSARIGETAIPAGQLVELRQAGRPRPMHPWDRPHLLFTNGDRWPGSVAEVRADRVRFVPDFGINQEVSVPLSAVAVAWVNDPRGGEPDPTDLALATASRTQDLVRLTNRDALRGTLVGLDKTTLTLDDGGKPVKVPRERVVAVALNTELARPVKPRGPFARVVLATGARVNLSEATVQDGRLVGKTPNGVTVRALVGDVISLTVCNGPAVELADLKPLRYEHTPYLNLTWPLAVDRSAAGGPLRLGPDTFDRGLGMHSQSRVTYAVPAAAARFEAWVGHDSETGTAGASVVTVSVDGKNVFGPAEIAGDQPPRRVAVPLPAHARELTLAVDFGPGGDVQDRVNWADARFIVPKRSAAPEPRRGSGVN